MILERCKHKSMSGNNYIPTLNQVNIENFRCFKKNQTIAPIKKINIFIGKNNVGKTSLLQFIQNYLIYQTTSLPVFDEKLDLIKPDLFEFSWKEKVIEYFPLSWIVRAKNSSEIHNQTADQSVLYDVCRFINCHYIAGMRHIEGTSLDELWIDGNGLIEYIALLLNAGPITATDISNAYNRRRNKESHFFEFDNLYDALMISDFLNCLNLKDINVDHQVLSDVSKIDMVLNLWKNSCKERISNIKRFLKTLLNSSNEINLTVDNERKHLLIHLKDNLELPFSHIGGGVQEAILLMTVVQMHQQSVVCIEEPELHLHPSAQRQLVDFFLTETDNQYFIATHSAHLINTIHLEKEKSQQIQIFSIEQEDGESTVRPIVSADQDDERELFSTLSDMGYMASDLLQANYLIFVEGPSDVRYLDFWIKKIAQKYGQPVVERGIHYQFVYSCGNSFFSAIDSPKYDPFLTVKHVLKVNKNIAVFFDKDDMGLSNAGKWEHKQQTVKELKDQGGFGGIWKEREVENCITKEIFQLALLIRYPKTPTTAFKAFNTNDFLNDDITGMYKSGKRYGDIDKMWISKMITTDKPSDIKEMMLPQSGESVESRLSFKTRSWTKKNKEKILDITGASGAKDICTKVATMLQSYQDNFAIKVQQKELKPQEIIQDNGTLIDFDSTMQVLIENILTANNIKFIRPLP